MVNKRDLVRSRTPSDTEMRYQLSQIPNKVDKEPNKGLSTNDFTDEYRKELDKSVQDRHHHNNLATLNHITSNNVSNWNSSSELAKSLAQPVELYSDNVGSNGNVQFSDNPLNYNYIILVFGTETNLENKLLIPNDKQFCIDLNTDASTSLKAFCKLSETGLERISGDNTVYIYKALGYIKKGAITFDSD